MALRFIFAVLLFVLFARTLVADSIIAPWSWMVLTGDGESEFVMLAPRGWAEPDLNRKGNEDLYGKLPIGYSESGLYRKGETSNPLYTFDWYAYSVDLSSDGRYAIRHGSWATSLDSMAVAFYDRGELLHKYKVGDLQKYTHPWHHTVSHFSWVDEWTFNSESNELYIATYSWSSWTFDATTGEVKSSSRGDRYMPILIYLPYILGVALLLAIALALRRWRSRSRIGKPFIKLPAIPWLPRMKNSSTREKVGLALCCIALPLVLWYFVDWLDPLSQPPVAGNPDPWWESADLNHHESEFDLAVDVEDITWCPTPLVNVKLKYVSEKQLVSMTFCLLAKADRSVIQSVEVPQSSVTALNNFEEVTLENIYKSSSWAPYEHEFVKGFDEGAYVLQVMLEFSTSEILSIDVSDVDVSNRHYDGRH